MKRVASEGLNIECFYERSPEVNSAMEVAKGWNAFLKAEESFCSNKQAFFASLREEFKSCLAELVNIGTKIKLVLLLEALRNLVVDLTGRPNFVEHQKDCHWHKTSMNTVSSWPVLLESLCFSFVSGSLDVDIVDGQRIWLENCDPTHLKQLKFSEACETEETVAQKLSRICSIGSLEELQQILAQLHGADVLSPSDGENLLVLICQRLDRDLGTAMLKELLLLFDDLGFDGEMGWQSSFMVAVKVASVEAVTLLWKRSMNQTMHHYSSDEWKSWVFAACARNDHHAKSVVSYLLEIPQNITIHKECKEILARGFGYACRHSVLDVVKVLWKVIGNVFDDEEECSFRWGDVWDVTPIMLACKNRFGGPDILRFLLSEVKTCFGYALNVNAMDSRQRSAFEYACSFGNADIVRTLLELKPEIQYRFNPQWVFLNTADPLGVLQAAEYNFIPNNDVSMLDVSVLFGPLRDSISVEVLWALCRTRIPLIPLGDPEDGHYYFDGNDNDENDPGLPVGLLEHAMRLNNHTISNYCAQETLTYREHYSGRTTLHTASRLGNTELIQKLMDNKLDPFVVSRRGNLAIDCAANDEVREMLAKYMTWDQRPEKVHWYGPLVSMRIKCLLLVIKCYVKEGHITHLFPREVKMMIAKSIIENEIIYLRRNPPLVEFR